MLIRLLMLTYSFNSRTPGGVRRADRYASLQCYSFNSRTPGGVRLRSSILSRSRIRFQFTHPGRGATSPGCAAQRPCTRFNSRTPGGVRLFYTAVPWGASDVSIHAPREGCDLSITSSISQPRYVSIHAPREGCDSIVVRTMSLLVQFQFTHPGRGATCNISSFVL